MVYGMGSTAGKEVDKDMVVHGDCINIWFRFWWQVFVPLSAACPYSSLTSEYESNCICISLRMIVISAKHLDSLQTGVRLNTIMPRSLVSTRRESFNPDRCHKHHHARIM